MRNRCSLILPPKFCNHSNSSINLKACAMMNNIQQTRIQLEKTYLSMGGKELEEDAASILTQLQSTLTRDLDQLAHKFSER